MSYIITKQISVSLLDCDYANVWNQVSFLLDIGVKSLHFDIMDGSFVKRISYGSKFVVDLQKHLGNTIDTSAHLMVRNAYRFIDGFFLYPPKRIVFHFEDNSSLKHIPLLFKKLDEKGIGLGLAINPSTKITSIDKSYLSIAKEILVMTVEPGQGGQKLMESQLDKTILLNQLRKAHGFNFTITIDGGVNGDTIVEASNYPIDQFVVGSYIWKNISNVKNNLEIMMQAIYKHQNSKKGV